MVNLLKSVCCRNLLKHAKDEKSCAELCMGLIEGYLCMPLMSNNRYPWHMLSEPC